MGLCGACILSLTTVYLHKLREAKRGTISNRICNEFVTIHRYCSLIAFDERVTFLFQHVKSLPCACAFVALFACRLMYNHHAIAHAYNAANAHAQGSDRAR